MITQASLDLIKLFEGCPTRPCWPGGMSGITLGYGCDIGANPDSLDYWTDYLPADAIARLSKAKGLQGNAARNILHTLLDIPIPPAISEKVLTTHDLPPVEAQVLSKFDGADSLPTDSFGALVSLVFNRGSALVGTNREEMSSLARNIKAKDYKAAIYDFTNMCHIWGSPSQSNVSGRRLAEAALFARGLRDAGMGDIPKETLLRGDDGPAVLELQQALAHAGLSLTIDGKFGSGTMINVYRWQQQATLPATGIAWPTALQTLGIDTH